MTATRRHGGPIAITRPGHGHHKANGTADPALWQSFAGVDYPKITGAEPCRRPDVDPETFFPDDAEDTEAAEQRTAQAKRLCDGCALATRQQCLAWALANPTTAGDGIWAGLTADDRRTALRRFRRNAARTTQQHREQEDES